MKLHSNSLILAFLCLFFVSTLALSAPQTESNSSPTSSEISDDTPDNATDRLEKATGPEKAPLNRAEVLVVSLTVFVLAIFVGFEIIAKVPPTLHTPLMSASNAISGITVIGAVIVAGQASGGLGTFLGLIAVVLAMINVVGGFFVTHRMLLMFKRR